MVVSEHRLKRMIRIVDMMRKQQYPNYTKIRRAFEQATFDTTETMVLTCDRKTIWQDLKILKEEFHCPWELSAERSQSGSAEMFIRFTNEILLRPDRQCGSCDFRTSLPGMAGSFSSAYCISRLSRKRLGARH